MYCVATVWQATGFLTLRCRFEAIRGTNLTTRWVLLLYFARERGPCFMKVTQVDRTCTRPVILFAFTS